jgi:hypothetical protein
LTAFRHERQESWFERLVSAFLTFHGVPDEAFIDNARALVTDHNAQTRSVVFNPVLGVRAKRELPEGKTAIP